MPKVYFASDFHLGIPDHTSSQVREKQLVKWLDTVSADAEAIYLMGDLFDFWYEYKTVVPKGYTRLLGKLSELCDKGVPVHLFRGNHDLWNFDYLTAETGVIMHSDTETVELLGKRFFLAHGDGLGPGDKGYKFLKKVFECKLNQFLFRWYHPDLGTRMGLYFSRRSRISNLIKEGKQESQMPIEKEPLVIFSRQMAQQRPDIDYFVFGHRHIPTVVAVTDKAKAVILGDWVTHFSYGVFDGNDLAIHYYSEKSRV